MVERSETHGGLVGRVTDAPGRAGSWAVQGVWSGGIWDPTRNLAVRCYRDRFLVGVMQVVGAEVVSRVGGDAILVVRGDDPACVPKTDDVLVFGEGQYSDLRIEHATPNLAPGSRVHVVEGGYPGLLLARGDVPNRLLVFHDAAAWIPRSGGLTLLCRGDTGQVQVRLPGLGLAGAEGFTLTHARNRVSAVALLQALGPVRNFVLDAGEEMLYRVVRGPRRRRKDTYTYFEPQVSISAGSLRLTVHPAEPDQLNLLVQPGDPIRLLLGVLTAAQTGSFLDAARLLGENVFSVERLLRRAEELAAQASASNGFQVRVEHGPAAAINDVAFRTLSDGLHQMRTRSVGREGTLYALEARRRWCRVLSHTGSPTTEEDWTLRYDEPMDRDVRGTVPRRVHVTFETQTPEGLRRGTGQLQSVS